MISMAKDIFTIVGASLGIIAFIQNFLKPIAEYNRHKWDELRKEVMDDIDFENIMFSLWHSRRINPQSMQRLERLIHYINDDFDEVRFKAVFSRRFSEKFSLISKLYNEWRALIQVPYWEPRGNHGESAWTFNKDFFLREKYGIPDSFETEQRATKEYVDHLEKAYDLVKEMRSEFRDIGEMVNRQAYEFILPWKWFARWRKKNRVI